MKIVLAGLGSFGMQVAGTLVEHGHDLVLVDADSDTARDAGGRFDCMTVHGRANSPGDLDKAGVHSAHAFIAMTGSDEINIIACSQAAQANPALVTIARVRNSEYAGLRPADREGLHHMINPEISAALDILGSLVYGALSDVISFHTVDIQIRTIPVPAGSPFHRQPLSQVAQSLGKACLVPLIARGEQWLIPAGDTPILEGDLLYLAARDDDFTGIFHALGKNRTSLRRVLILGGGRVGSAVAGWLTGDARPGKSAMGRMELGRILGRGKVTVLEPSAERCKALSGDLHHALVIHGDIGDENLFREENLGDNDVMVCCTDVEERNILAGLYGKRMGIRRSIALVHSRNYLSLARHMELDVAVSLRNAVANSVIRILRTGEAESVHSLGDGTVEVLEYEVDPGCPAEGKALMNLGLPRETLVMGIRRSGESFIARGPTVLQAGDNVVILSRHHHARKVDGFFRPEPV